MKRDYIPPLSGTDKRCLLALAGILVAVTVGYEATDGVALRAAQREDSPQVEVAEIAPHIDCKALVEAVEARRDREYREDIPLSGALQAALREACEEHSVPVSLALGLIEVESRFDEMADNGLCYGLCQLNKRYYPDNLTPAENIQAGIAHLGGLLEQYEDTAAALTAYNAGHDTGNRAYARAVLDASEKWGAG